MDTPTAIPRSAFQRWLHYNDNAGQRENGNGEKKTHIETPRWGEDFRYAKSRAVRFTWPNLGRQAWSIPRLLRRQVTIQKTIVFIRMAAFFVWIFATINIAGVLFATQNEGALVHAGQMRFQMSIPASICVSINSICIFLITFMVERIIQSLNGKASHPSNNE